MLQDDSMAFLKVQSKQKSNEFFPENCIPKFLNKTFQRKFGEKNPHLFRQPSFAFDSKVESPASELGENTITDSSPDGNTKNPGVKCGVLVVSQKIRT